MAHSIEKKNITVESDAINPIQIYAENNTIPVSDIKAIFPNAVALKSPDNTFIMPRNHMFILLPEFSKCKVFLEKEKPMMKKTSIRVQCRSKVKLQGSIGYHESIGF